MSIIRQGAPAAVAVVIGALAVSHPDPRLVNGQPSSLPGYAQILLNGGPNCGGAKISPDTVLTAAHCAAGAGNGALWVKVSGQGESSVSAVTVHPAYNKPAGSYDNDIAILTLATPIDGPVLRLPVDLPPKGSPVRAWGMGWTAWQGPTASTLQYLDMTVIDVKEGSQAAGAQPHPGRIYAKTPAGTSCKGDSGSPLMSGDTLVGLTATVFSGCANGSPVGFTSVLSYLGWIASVTDEQQPRPGWWCLASGCDGTGITMAPGAGTIYVAWLYYDGDQRAWLSAYLHRTAQGFYQGWVSDCKPSACSATGIAVDLRVNSPTSVMMTWGGNVVSLKALEGF